MPILPLGGGRLESAGFHLLGFAPVEHSLQMQLCAPTLDVVGENMLNVRAVDEPVTHHVVKAAGLGQEPKHCLMSPRNHRGEVVNHFNEGGSPFDHPLVMEGDVKVGLLVSHPAEALVEAFEVAPDVSVVWAESG